MAHSHSHSHHGHSHDAANTVAHNKAYFDKMASTYGQTTSHQQVNSYITAALLSTLPLSDSSTCLLDYACGTGLISRALAPHVASIVGMDVSSGMVEEYNRAVNNQGIPESEMKAIVADLCSDEGEERKEVGDYGEFDVAVCTLALHHMPDPALAMKRVTERLKEGSGVFAVVDFRPHSPVEEKMKHIVSHTGFSEENIRRWFTEAGLEEVEFHDVGPEGSKGKGITMVWNNDSGSVIRVEREIFMAIGRRSKDSGSSL